MGTFFLPHKHKCLAAPWKAEKASSCMFFQKQQNLWAGLPKKKNLPVKIFTINCNPNSPVISKIHIALNA